MVWEDACMADDQDTVPGVQPAVTVGKIVSMDEKQITVAADVFHDDVFRRAQTIPRGMVKRVIPLKTIKVPEFDPA